MLWSSQNYSVSLPHRRALPPYELLEDELQLALNVSDTPCAVSRKKSERAQQKTQMETGSTRARSRRGVQTTMVHTISVLEDYRPAILF